MEMTAMAKVTTLAMTAELAIRRSSTEESPSGPPKRIIFFFEQNFYRESLKKQLMKDLDFKMPKHKIQNDHVSFIIMAHSTAE